MKNSLLLLFVFCFFQLGWSQEKPPVSQGKNVMIVYGSDACHHCTDTKKFLTENKIAFVFYDIDKNPDALKEMLAKLKKANISTSNLSIPVIDKHGDIFTNNLPFETFLQKLK